MTTADYKKFILDKIKEVIPVYFKKSNQAYKYSNGDLIYYIGLQSSKYSTSKEFTITINIGIGSELVYKLEGKKIISHLRGHFSKRIGNYLTPSIDKWWTITDLKTLQDASSEIAQIINEKVLPEFNEIQSTQDLVDLWMQDICFGLSEIERQTYLVLLNQHFN